MDWAKYGRPKLCPSVPFAAACGDIMLVFVGSLVVFGVKEESRSRFRREERDDATSPLVNVAVQSQLIIQRDQTLAWHPLPYGFLTMGVLLGHIQGALDDMKVVNYGADTRDFMFNIED